MIAAPDDQPGQGRVLVVDDDADLARELAEALEADGYAVVVARSVPQAQAIVAADAGRIGVVVSDLRMPGLSGIDLLRWLREHPNGAGAPELILMSGHASAADGDAARQAGAVAVLRKPFAWPDLLAAVVSAFGAWRRRDQR